MLILTLLFPVITLAGNQGSDWDRVLDRYQEICGQCIVLRDRITAGEPVSDKAVTSLLQELTQLRNTLQSASGSMTASQKARFNAIRDSYLKGNTVETDKKSKETVAESVAETAARPADSNADALADIQKKIRARNDSLVNLLDEMVARVDVPNTSAPISGPISSENVLSEERIYDNDYNGKPVSGLRSNEIELYALTAYNRIWSFGGMLVLRGEPFRSGYIGVLSNFSNIGHDYSCSSSGAIDGGGVFWGDGGIADNELFITAGLTVWHNIKGNISAYAGTGYGINERLWRDISGKWAMVSDVSGRGLVLQGMASFRFGKLCVMPNLIYMPSTNYLLPSLGVGYAF